MNPLNPIFAVVIYFIAFLTAFTISLKYKIIESKDQRYEGIDGLRGFLALGVFIHHSSIWYNYLQTNSWESPKSNLFNHLGQTSVSFFFMITAFLFINKLLNVNDKKFDWNIFFISRIFRLLPMMLFSLFALIFIVMIISKWEIKVPLVSFIVGILHWITFTIASTPTINDSVYTTIINAGVFWSLPFEWLFYFSLPVVSLLILKNKPSILYLIMSVLFILFF